MSLIDKLEDLVAKVDTEYQEKMEAVILEIVPGCRKGTCAMPPAVPERIRVLSPSWYRAAVEFQGKPESEQLDFCSRCCCTGE